MSRKIAAKKSDEVSVVVAIDKNKNSQSAMKWAIDHILSRGQCVTILHVKTKPSSIPTPAGNQVNISDVRDDVAKAYKQQLDNQTRKMFLTFRCFCNRKDIHYNEVIIEDTDIGKAIVDYVLSNSIGTLVLGAPSKGGFVKRFRTHDVTTNVSRTAPDYCTVYVIGKGEIQSVRSATAPPPPPTTFSSHVKLQPLPSNIPEPITEGHSAPAINPRYRARTDRPQHTPPRLHEETEMIRSPFTRLGRTFESSLPDSDISFVSRERPCTDTMPISLSDSMDFGTPRYSSAGSEYDNRSSSYASSYSGNRSMDFSSSLYCSSASMESGRTSLSSQTMDTDMEYEMRRLKLELKQTMDMYGAACKEALSAKQRAKELQSWKSQEEQKLEEVRHAEEAAVLLAQKEKAKRQAAIEATQAAQRVAELEEQKRMNLEMNACKEADTERKMAIDSFGQNLRYRRYSVEEVETATESFSSSRKIGEGGYGPVYMGHLDHTPVAIKILRSDAAQGQSQFHQEVEVLSCIRHPSMVLLLGACPEYGCLVYEYMANGSLEDRLFRRNNTPVLPWQARFRIAAEIATGLLFLHQTKPEPLVHRDLKPANILLDRNYVSKISDVGLARLLPSSAASSVTQYRMTATAGTFCYIDPEYQQTGMLGTKSDVYSLGIMLLQIITAKPPMGLAHHVENAIEEGTFGEMLDPDVVDWPMEEALNFAKLALKCAELRRRDRPDLGKVVLPELNKLRDLAEENMSFITLGGSAGPSPNHSTVSPHSRKYGSDVSH